VGNAGVGKSTLVEKLAGLPLGSRSSNSTTSFTKESEYFWDKDGRHFKKCPPDVAASLNLNTQETF
jgi:predicted ATPase